jgi:hypothetical protein
MNTTLYGFAGFLYSNGCEVFNLQTAERAQRFALLLQGRKVDAVARGRFVKVYH